MSPFFANTEHFIPSSTSSENVSVNCEPSPSCQPLLSGIQAAGYLPSAHFSHGAVDVRYFASSAVADGSRS
jgi:hypothetical protein